MRKPKVMSDFFKLTGSENIIIDNNKYILKNAKFGDIAEEGNKEPIKEELDEITNQENFK